MRVTLWQEYRHSLAINAGRVAVRDGEQEFTYADLDRWSGVVADRLHSRGVGRGDAVALYLRNRVEFLVSDIAVARLGAVRVPINVMASIDTVGYFIELTNAKALIVDGALPTEGVAVPGIVFEVLLGESPRAGAEPFPGPDEGGAYAVSDAEHSDGSAPSVVYSTGGTTGRPKGVLHTETSIVMANYAQLLEAEITETDRLLLMTPLAHAAGMFAQSALLRGATIVLRDGFDAAGTLDLLEREQITWTFLVPTMIYRLLDLIGARPGYRSPLRTIVYGAAPIAPGRLAEALGVFGQVFIQQYGQSEAIIWGTRLSRLDHDLSRPRLLESCGRPSIMADVRIVDDNGRDVRLGEAGEVCLRTPYVMREYVGNPEATAEKIQDGWVRTGDLGVMESDGYVFLKDRKGDMVITGGLNVYCREVEDVLSKHEQVRSVAVFGIPHHDWGESVHACVVAGDDSLSEAALIAWSRGKLAAYAVPKSIEFVAELPETSYGKIDKKQLRARYWRGHDRVIS